MQIERSKPSDAETKRVAAASSARPTRSSEASVSPESVASSEARRIPAISLGSKMLRTVTALLALSTRELAAAAPSYRRSSTLRVDDFLARSEPDPFRFDGRHGIRIGNLYTDRACADHLASLLEDVEDDGLHRVVRDAIELEPGTTTTPPLQIDCSPSPVSRFTAAPTGSQVYFGSYVGAHRHIGIMYGDSPEVTYKDHLGQTFGPNVVLRHEIEHAAHDTRSRNMFVLRALMPDIAFGNLEERATYRESNAKNAALRAIRPCDYRAIVPKPLERDPISRLLFGDQLSRKRIPENLHAEWDGVIDRLTDEHEARAFLRRRLGPVDADVERTAADLVRHGALTLRAYFKGRRTAENVAALRDDLASIEAMVLAEESRASLHGCRPIAETRIDGTAWAAYQVVSGFDHSPEHLGALPAMTDAYAWRQQIRVKDDTQATSGMWSIARMLARFGEGPIIETDASGPTVTASFAGDVAPVVLDSRSFASMRDRIDGALRLRPNATRVAVDMTALPEYQRGSLLRLAEYSSDLVSELRAAGKAAIFCYGGRVFTAYPTADYRPGFPENSFD